jgi:hypothetical protein
LPPWEHRRRWAAICGGATRPGIGRSNLSAASDAHYAVASEAVGRILVSLPDRFFGFASAQPTGAGWILSMVRRAVVGPGACGIKVHRHDARINVRSAM